MKIKSLFSRQKADDTPLESPSASEKGVNEKDVKIAVNEDDLYSHLTPGQRKILEDQRHVPVDRKVRLTEILAFQTRKELFFNCLGLVGAVAVGVAQPAQILIFGNLTQKLVDFLQLRNADPASEEFRRAQAAVLHDVNDLSLYLVAIGGGVLICTYLYMASWVVSGENMTARIRKGYYKAILRQNVAHFDELGAGQIASRIESDCDLIQRGCSENIPIAVTYLAAFVAGFVIAFTRQWKLSLVLVSTIPVIAIAGTSLDWIEGKYRPKMSELVSQAGATAEESFSSIRVVKAFGTESRLAKMYDRVSSQTLPIGKFVGYGLGIGIGCLFVAAFAAYSLGFFFGTTLALGGHANIGDIVVVLEAILIGSFSLSQAPAKLVALSQGLSASPKILDTIKRVPPIDAYDPKGKKPDCKGDIVFNDVDFYYPSRPQVKVLDKVSIRFEAGKTTALVGESGSGKSSCVGIIERFYNILGGQVTVDGIPIEEINIQHLRRKIGYVQQEPTLFSGTVLENVKQGLIGTPEWDAPVETQQKYIEDACRQANAHDFISKLPQGYNTVVGERGVLLSGGQRQRIAIARAVIKNPVILLLDEATSALDTTSERLIQAVLDEQSKNRTVISIAHRLSTIRNAHHIVVMKTGQVLERGTHDELLSLEDGYYARLVTAQKLREATGEEEPVATEKVEEVKVERGQNIRRMTTTVSVSSELMANKKGDEEKKKRYPFWTVVRRIAKFNKESKWIYARGFSSSFLSAAVMPIYGILFAFAINVFVSTDRDYLRHEGNRYALWFFVVSIVAAAAIFGQFSQFLTAAEVMSRNVRLLTFTRILQQDVAFFDSSENSSGGLTSKVADLAEKIKPLAGTSLGTLVQNIGTMIIGIILGIAFQWKIGLVGTATVPLCAAGGILRLYIVILKEERTKTEHQQSAQLAVEGANAIRTVASLTREEEALRQYADSLEGPAAYIRKVAYISNIAFSVSQACPYWVIALIFWYGSRLLIIDGISLTRFFVALICIVFGAIEFGNSFTYVPDVSRSLSAGRDLLTLVDTKTAIDAESEEGLKEELKGHIKFSNLHFRYPTRPDVPVLRGIDIEVKPGQYVAICGPSGSGKSTAIALMERWYDPLVGQITIDGHNISDLNVRHYRSQMALVSQDSCLYQGSIKDNILLGSLKEPENVSDEEIWQACAEANIKIFVESLPNGIDTQIGGKGVTLSGGQRQRICLARALIRQPRIVLLDEATAALDSESEKVVQDALDKAARQRSTLAIAHRISTIQNADKIYVLQEGRIAESGTHQGLLAKKGVYFDLVAQQALDRHDN